MNYKVYILRNAELFIRSLQVKLRAKVFRTIELLQEFGYSLPEPHAKKIRGTDKLYEL